MNIEDVEIKMTLGTNLCPLDRKMVLSIFTNRYTGNNKPSWVNKANSKVFPGGVYPLQFKSDQDWLENTKFAVDEDGRLVKKSTCFSFPTWPNNPELRIEVNKIKRVVS